MHGALPYGPREGVSAGKAGAGGYKWQTDDATFRVWGGRWAHNLGAQDAAQ